MPAYRHILAALDLSDDSPQIAARALELAGFYQARISLLHVVEYLPIDLTEELVLTQPPEVNEHLLQQARVSLEALAAQLGLDPAACRVELGVTKAEILRVADELGADLLVLGSHGRHGLALLLGSTANSVLHNSPCDVLAIRVGN